MMMTTSTIIASCLCNMSQYKLPRSYQNTEYSQKSSGKSKIAPLDAGMSGVRCRGNCVEERVVSNWKMRSFRLFWEQDVWTHLPSRTVQAPNVVLDVLDDVFGTRFLSNRFPGRFGCGWSWPPCSSYTNPCYYFLWGYLTKIVSTATSRTLFRSLTDLLTHSLTHSLTPWGSPPWEANSHSASQEIPCILWNPIVNYGVHKTPTNSQSCVTFRNELFFC
jgi:hypothetical protein